MRRRRPRRGVKASRLKPARDGVVRWCGRGATAPTSNDGPFFVLRVVVLRVKYRLGFVSVSKPRATSTTRRRTMQTRRGRVRSGNSGSTARALTTRGRENNCYEKRRHARGVVSRALAQLPACCCSTVTASVTLARRVLRSSSTLRISGVSISSSMPVIFAAWWGLISWILL